MISETPRRIIEESSGAYIFREQNEMVQVKIGDTVIGDGKVKICMPISAGSLTEVKEELDYVAAGTCDIVEVRYDCFREKNDRELEVLLSEIKKRLSKKLLLFTYRTNLEGGSGINDYDEYYNVNREAILSGHIDIVDIEFTKEHELIEKLIELAHENSVKVIVSKHFFEKSLSKDETIEMLLTMQDKGADIIKLAVSVENDKAAHEVISAAKEMYEKYSKIPFVTIGMGERGKVTRYLEPFYGSSITYVKGIRETAPGQLDLSELHNIIRTDGLIFEYKQDDNKDSIKAINDLSVEIERGSFTAIIGKNGSGKSTFAKNINALLLPSGGAVYVNDFNTADEEKVWDIRQTVGMVFQNPDNQLVSSIVEDDVAFGPENLGIPPDEIRKRVDESLHAVGMYELRKMAPHLLSGGQKQRVAIAGVVAMMPECIVFDEPTAMLDPSGRREVMNIIKELSDKGITIILITHFMEEAAMADRVIIMEDGKIALDGAPKEVFRSVDYIENLSLDVPFAVKAAHKLRSKGIEIPADIINTDELVAYLCQYR